jgi:mono/diheme cytochrome c family protein
MAAAPRASQQDASQTPADDYKITPEDISRKNPVRSSPEGLAEARRIFKYDCAMCHGPAGDGKGEIVESMTLTMHDWKNPTALEGKTDGEIFYIITKGKGKMMGEGDRQSEKLRWSLVNLVRSMAGKATQTKSPTSSGATSH